MSVPDFKPGDIVLIEGTTGFHAEINGQKAILLKRYTDEEEWGPYWSLSVQWHGHKSWNVLEENLRVIPAEKTDFKPGDLAELTGLTGRLYEPMNGTIVTVIRIDLSNSNHIKVQHPNCSNYTVYHRNNLKPYEKKTAPTSAEYPSGWIRTSDQLPNPGQTVLGFTRDGMGGEMMAGAFYFEGPDSAPGIFIDVIGDEWMNAPDYWLEIPEPPTE